MSSVRLNQQIRNTILQRMLKHAFSERLETLDKEEEALGDDIYDDIYPKEIRKKMAALPADYLPIAKYHHVAFGGQVTQIKWAELRRISSDLYGYHTAKAYDAADPFSKRFFELEKHRAKLKEERERAAKAAAAALNSCTTIKKLLEVWPEAAPFVEDFTAPPAVLALTLSIKDLNAQLGLAGITSVK